ncbi:MAG: squalene/phytoene synthase family protein, partial [Acidimicrobiia bacterium]|nr:squalene/phytoene synthase family protein [Acidimicrobiia bacterium]
MSRVASGLDRLARLVDLLDGLARIGDDDSLAEIRRRAAGGAGADDAMVVEMAQLACTFDADEVDGLLAGATQSAGQPSIDTFDELLAWCALVSGPQATIALGLLGAPEHAATRATRSAFAGMRLAGLLGQLGSDHRAGRVLLPRADLARFDASAHALGAGAADGPLRRVVALEVARVHGLLDATVGVLMVLAAAERPALARHGALARARLHAIERARH